jgi:hypothetical protein
VNDPFLKDRAVSGVAETPVLRPLLASAQAATDRLASEIRALEGALPDPSASALREGLRALHAALFQMHALHGGPVLARPARARVDPLSVVCDVVEEAQQEGLAVEVDARGTIGTIDASGPELQRLLRWLVDRATSGTSGVVRVVVSADGPTVVVALPWHDEIAEGVGAQERDWLERAAGALSGRLDFVEGKVRLLLPREATVPFDSSLEELAREVQDLRRERQTRAHEVERSTCALRSAQVEAELARRQLSRIERSTLRAVGDLQKTFESLDAMSGLVADPDGLGRDLQAVSQSGLARVMELVAEVDTAAMTAANSVTPPWSQIPSARGIHVAEDLLAVIEEDDPSITQDDPTPR